MNVKKVVFAGVFSFPEGIAASSRIRNLVYGMLDAVPSVHVVSMYGSEGKSFNPETEGSIFSHVPILSMPHPNTSKILILRNRLKMYSKLTCLVDSTVEQLDGSEQEVLFLYGRSYIFLSMLLRKLKNKGYKTKTIFDVVEPHRSTTSLLEYFKHPFLIDSTLVFKCLLNKFTTCTYITTALMERYAKNEALCYILPGVITKCANAIPNNIPESTLRIGYLGTLIGKDYPELLFKCCQELTAKNVDWTLIIIGRFEFFSEGRRWKRKFINEFCHSKVKFFHNPSDDEKNELLEKVDFVTMFRKPEALQEFTFPTRSVEVMAQGRVIITNTFGEFCNYLKESNSSVIIDDSDVTNSIKDWVENFNSKQYNQMFYSSQYLLDTHFNTHKHCNQLLRFMGSC
jgi:glycosyltransferase involved in cell wall biosynthesis